MFAPLSAKAPSQAMLAVVPSVSDPDAVGAAIAIGGPAGMPMLEASFQVARLFGAELRALTVNTTELPFAMDGASTLREYRAPTGSLGSTFTISVTPPTVTTYCSIGLPAPPSGFDQLTRRP
jgi:hypothetical protein